MTLNKKTILNAIFCLSIDSRLEYGDIFTTKNDSIFLLHTGFTTEQILLTLDSADIQKINNCIVLHNQMIFDDV